MDENEIKYNHLEAIREDVRDEIKSRIKQRDIYSIELTVALATILGIAYSNSSFKDIILLAPLPTIYFTLLIFYSYRIHKNLSEYLRNKIEPKFIELTNLPKDTEIETYFHKNSLVGVRSLFFLLMLWVVCIIVFIIYQPWIKVDTNSNLIIAIIYLISAGIITVFYSIWNKQLFQKKTKK